MENGDLRFKCSTLFIDTKLIVNFQYRQGLSMTLPLEEDLSLNYAGFERPVICPLTNKTREDIYQEEYSIWMKHDMEDFYPLLDKWYCTETIVTTTSHTIILGIATKKNMKSWKVYL